LTTNSLTKPDYAEWLAELEPCPKCGIRMEQTLDGDELSECYEIHMRHRGQSTEQMLRDIAAIPYLCDRCMHKMEEAHNRGETSAAVKAHIEHIYGRGLLPSDARDQTFEKSIPSYEQANPDSWQICRAWTFSNSNLWMMGPTGLGKTFAARCIMNRVMSERATVAEISALEIIKMSRQFKAMDLVVPYVRSRLLCVEDIDKGVWNQEALDLLWYIIDRRGKYQRLIITSNNKPAEVKAVWSNNTKNASTLETLFRRLTPMGRVEFEGDYRKIGRP